MNKLGTHDTTEIDELAKKQIENMKEMYRLGYFDAMNSLSIKDKKRGQYIGTMQKSFEQHILIDEHYKPVLALKTALGLL